MSGTGLDLSYDRDAAGQILSIRALAPQESFTFHYNDADWLTASVRGGEDAIVHRDHLGSVRRLTRMGPRPR